MLGRLDEFDQDDACEQMKKGQEIPCGLLAAQGDAFEALESVDGLLDTGARLVRACSGSLRRLRVPIMTLGKTRSPLEWC